MTTMLQRALLTTAVLPLAALAACGSDSGDGGGASEEAAAFAGGSAEEIGTSALAAMRELESLRLSGTVTSDGQELELDLALDRSGSCTGTIGAEGGTAEFRQSGDQAFLKGDEAFWEISTGSAEQAAMILQVVGDRWVVVPAGEGFGDICDLDSLLAEFDDEEEEFGEKGEVDEIGGREAIAVVDTEDDGGEVTGWVATEEPHHILRFESAGGDEPGTMDFSEFDEPVEVEIPAAADTIDLEKLAG